MKYCNRNISVNGFSVYEVHTILSVPIINSCATGKERLLCIAPRSEFRRSIAMSHTSARLYMFGIKPACGSRWRLGRRGGDRSRKNESTHLQPGLSGCTSIPVSNAIPI